MSLAASGHRQCFFEVAIQADRADGDRRQAGQLLRPAGAVQSVKDGGLLLVTCTDMAVLCGKLVEKNRNFIHQELIL